jgi:ubiquinone/menaquinone biosynthesis C-methylase UbiE/GT2 family glycosyltransferase
MEKSVAAVIPTKNNVHTIQACLSSLMPYRERGLIDEIIVVDAHSSDGTLEIVRDFPVTLIFDEGVRPYFAREIGWRRTSAELILFMDADTCLGEGFFPDICDCFQDERLGIVSPQQKAVVTNRVTRTIGEWWTFHTGRLDGLVATEPSAWSVFQRLYQRITWSGEKYAVAGGPCYMVRRTCLEALNGFECPEGSADLMLSRRIIEEGWKSGWLVDAPFYHYPVRSVKKLFKQRYHWGQTDALTQRRSRKTCQKIALSVGRLGTPVIGVWLAIRFKNPLHLFLFPLTHFAWLIGYLTAWPWKKEVRMETIVNKEQDKKAEIKLLDKLVEMESYDFDSERSNREKQLRLLELTTAPSQRILDAGCGPGTYGIILAQCGHQVIGIDISGSATIVAKKRADEKRVNFSPVAGYLEKLPFAADSFDICFCGYTLHHFPDISSVVSEFTRVTKPGGKLILLEPNGSNPAVRFSKKLENLVQDWLFKLGIDSPNEVVHQPAVYSEALGEKGIINIKVDSDYTGGLPPLPAKTGKQTLGYFNFILIHVIARLRRVLYIIAVKVLPRPLNGADLVITGIKGPPLGEVNSK